MDMNVPENTGPVEDPSKTSQEADNLNKNLSETQNDKEADEAVVAGVAAVGWFALKWHHFKQFFKKWWNNKKARYLTLGGLAVLVTVLLVIPVTRYGILNAMGFDATVKVYVVDDETGEPLLNAFVRIGGSEGETGSDGRAVISDVNLGRQELSITKPGYGDLLESQNVSLGGSDYGEQRLLVTGTRLNFRLVDFHSQQPINEVVAEAGEASAIGGADGLVKLVVEPTDEPFDVSFKAENYNDTEFSTQPDNFNQQEVKLVTAGWNAFISKREGKFDLYRQKLDGNETEKVLAGTGDERESTLVLLTDPSGQHAAVVSTRDDERNEDDFVLSGLYVVDLTSKESIRVDLAENITLVGWHGNSLIYVYAQAGGSGYDPERLQIKQFRIGDLTGRTLVSSNYFNDVELAEGRVYYSPSESFKQSQPPEHFFSMLPDGSDQRSHITESTGQIVRTEFGQLIVETYDESKGYKQTWYDFDLATQTIVKLAGRPANFEYWNTSGEFVDDSSGNQTAWLDTRDGKQVLIVRSEDGQEKVIWQGVGAEAPIRWVGESLLVFRVVDDGSFDYAVSVNGGEAVKLGNVTNVSGYGG